MMHPTGKAAGTIGVIFQKTADSACQSSFARITSWLFSGLKSQRHPGPATRRVGGH